MKNTTPKSSVLDYLSFLFLAIIIVGFLYGGLTINKLQKANLALETKQNNLSEKFITLEGQLIDNHNQVAELSGQLEKNASDLAYYKKLALAQPKAILGATTTAPETTTPVVEAKPVVQTQVVTKKIYVQEKPKYEATVTVKGVGSYKVAVSSDDTAFSILKKAANQYGFTVESQSFDFGAFVTSIAGEKPVGNQYWAFYYNGKYSQVGASDQKVSAGDTIFWQLESF